ncbi:mandelate racemase/muconate lactonizing enzyme family protein [Robertmurraya kyonggiensis]|uniref:Mandelate racemase/muconate lactonizing enzyme family protein n=1 Tax=Robertmurraya kyonggiensis TaxID=1037680 RepID=A0A4U1D252_9BACI|nr:mandelate racemase/muconate lactonizing enzyme family protein [Robertmurraya kyonggiensis]TKC16352.1 mandelate racemase/muconate lactonizing enzyme family protein [Robertmurraya kyonggiensis]
MKIIDIKATPIRMPLKEAFDGSTYGMTERCTIITEVITDEGINGRTFLGDNRDHQAEVVALINNNMRTILLSEDPTCIERCWQKMFQLTIRLGNRPQICSAIAAVDAALWDLLGKASNQPIYKLVGGYSDTVKPMIIGGYYGKDRDSQYLCEEMLDFKEQGFAGAKIKVGGLSPREDANRIEAVRGAIGEDFIIACDANQGWTRFEAVEFGLRVRDLDIAWFEEPVQWHDYIPGMRYVREQTGLAVNAGQSDFYHDGCRRMIEARSVDIINYDVSGGSGISDWLKVARMAELYQIRMAHHEDPLIAMHLLAGISLGLYPEYFSEIRDPLTPNIVVNQPKIQDGKIKVSEQPGFGLEFDEDFIKKYRVDQ